MGSAASPDAIVAWAEQQDSPADTPSYRRMTDAERALIFFLNEQGLSQVAIAQRLGRAQSSINAFLAKFEDTTTPAKRFLAGQALRLAEHVVETGKAADHIQVLKGIGVLEEKQALGLSIQIGGAGDVKIGVLVSTTGEGQSPHPDRS